MEQERAVADPPLPDTDRIRAWLEEVTDPEIPVVSIIDLGILRDVSWERQDSGDPTCVITITPTYSGCPAMQVISESIEQALHAKGIDRIELKTVLSPAWTTDWMTESGKEKLRNYGIAPPAQNVIDISGISRRSNPGPQVTCPHCGSENTRCVSQFGSTSCKALYKCMTCAEPFDYFKCH